MADARMTAVTPPYPAVPRGGSGLMADILAEALRDLLRAEDEVNRALARRAAREALRAHEALRA